VLKKIQTDKYFMFEEVMFRISCSNPTWASTVENYLCLTAVENPLKAAEITIDLHEVTYQEELNQLLPLPDDAFINLENTLLIGREVPYRSYTRGHCKWCDFEGFGRYMFDRKNNQLMSVRFQNSGISPAHTDNIFIHSPLIALLSNFGYLSVHASAVQVNGKGILFTGKGGRGKSTAAYAMLRRGHAVLSDDRILLKKNQVYTAHSLTDVIKQHLETSRKLFPELPGLKPLYSIDGECYYKVSAIEGLAHLGSTKVDYLLFFERTGKPQSHLEKVNPSKAIGELFPVTLSIFNPEELKSKFELLLDFLEQVSCYKVYYGTDMDHFAACVEDLATGGNS
jgi:hypothetical protein